MSPTQQLVQAAGGWGDILAGNPRWRQRFELTPAGFALAGAGYVVVVLATLAAAVALSGAPELSVVITAGLFNLLPLGGLVLATLLTYVTLRVERPLLDLLVPAAHALSLVLLVGTVLSLFGLGSGPLLLAVLAALLMRAAQICGGFGLGVSLAYAGLVVVVLVVLRDSLYMLVTPPALPI